MNQPSKIILRADANSTIGLGHLSRVKAIKDFLSPDFQATFITSHNSELSLLKDQESVYFLPAEITIKDEPQFLSQNFPAEKYLIILDGYHFLGDYQIKLKTFGYRLIYIDDLISTNIYSDIVINHSLGVNEKDYFKLKNTKKALGADFAILRNEFLNLPKKKTLKIPSLITSVFICFGGADPFDLTFLFTDALLELKQLKKINLVMGAAYNHRKIDQVLDNRLIKYQNLSQNSMIELMQDSDLAIVPSSTISYEACCVNMTILSGFYIKNQQSIYHGLLKNNLIYGAGSLNDLTIEKVKKLVMNIINDQHDNRLKKIMQQQYFFHGKQKMYFLKLFNELVAKK